MPAWIWRARFCGCMTAVASDASSEPLSTLQLAKALSGIWEGYSQVSCRGGVFGLSGDVKVSDYFLFPELNKHISIYTDVYTARSLRPKNAHSCALTWPFDPLIKNMKKHTKNLHFYTHPHVTGQERNENSLGTHRSAFRGRQMTTSLGRNPRGDKYSIRLGD